MPYYDNFKSLQERQNLEGKVDRYLKSVGQDEWSRKERSYRQSADELGNYLSGGQYTSADNQKWRDSATKAVADLDEQLKSYKKSSDEYKTLDAYRNYYQSSLDNFDRLDPFVSAQEYAGFDGWHDEASYKTQKDSLQQTMDALQAEMDGLEDQAGADYQSLKQYYDMYSSAMEGLDQREKLDRSFDSADDYATFQRSFDYKNSSELKKNLEAKKAELAPLEEQVKRQSITGDLSTIDPQLYAKTVQLQREVAEMESDLGKLEGYQAQQILSNYNWGIFDGKTDYGKVVDDLKDALQMAKTDEDKAKIEMQLRTLAGANYDGTTENGGFDEGTLYGQWLMSKFDTKEAQKRLDEINKELADMGLAEDRWEAGLMSFGEGFQSGSDFAGFSGQNLEGGQEVSKELDPHVAELRREKRELTQKMQLSQRLQDRQDIANKIPQVEGYADLVEEGKKHLTGGGTAYYQRGYDEHNSNSETGIVGTNALKNFDALTGELTEEDQRMLEQLGMTGLRDSLLAAIGAEHMGKDIGYTVQDILDAYEGQMAQFAGYKAAEKISNMDSDFARWNTQVFGVGLASGLNQFGQGVKGFFSDDYMAPNKMTATAQFTRQDLKRYGKEQLLPDSEAGGSNVSQLLFDTVQTTGNMLPMIALSYLTSGAAGALGMAAEAAGTVGQVVGAATMGVSSAGNTYQQALAEGWDKEDARVFSLITGTAEGALQYAIGGISALGGVGEEQILAAAQGINNAAVRFATETGVHILSETTEELAQNRLERLLRYTMVDEGNGDWLSWNQDDWYTVLVTALSTGALEGRGSYQNTFGAQKTGEALSGTKALPSKALLKSTRERNETINKVGEYMKSSPAVEYTLVELGAQMGENTASYELATRIKEGKAPANAMNLGNLYNAYLNDNAVGKTKAERAKGYDDAMMSIVGGAVKYNEIQKLEGEQKQAELVHQEIVKANPGAEVLDKTASELTALGLPGTQAAKVSPVLNKVLSGESLSKAEMEQLTDDSFAAKAARAVLSQRNENVQVDMDPAAAREAILALTDDVKAIKKQQAALTQQEVVQAAMDAVADFNVKRAAAGANVTPDTAAQNLVSEETAAKVTESSQKVEDAKAALDRIQKMSFREIANLANSDVAEVLGEEGAVEVGALVHEMNVLEAKVEGMRENKMPTKAQRDAMSKAQAQLADIKRQVEDAYQKNYEAVRARAEEAQTATDQPAAAQAGGNTVIPAKQQGAPADVILNPDGGVQMTRQQFVQQQVANGVSEEEANKNFDEASAQSVALYGGKYQRGQATEAQQKNSAQKKTARRAKLTGKVEYWEGGKLAGAMYDAVTEAEAVELLGESEMAFLNDVLSKVANVTLIKSKDKAGANGIFYRDGRIYLDVNAGAEFDQRSIVLTAAHELTHFIREYNEGAYNALRDFVAAELQAKGILEERIKSEQNGYRAGTGKELSREDAIEEVVANACETMLTDSEQIQRFAEEHPTEARTIIDWLSDFFHKIADAFDELVAVHPEAKAMQEKISELRDQWLEALSGANENATASSMEDVVQNEVNAEGDVVATTSEEGQGVFSLRTYNEGGRAALDVFLAKQVKKGALDRTQADEIRRQMETLYEVCKKFDDGTYAPFSAWSNATVVEVDGRPVFSVVKANGEYKLNLDFSLVCKKRRALDAVFNEMISRGIMNKIVGDKSFLQMGPASIAQINNIIREHGFETACALCFVDSKRFRQAMIADAFVGMYNEQVNSLTEGTGKKATYFNYGGDRSLLNQDSNRTGIDTLADWELNWGRVNEILATEKKGTVAWKIANHLKTHPEARKLAARGDFMSTAGFDALKTSNPELLGLYNAKKGAGGPKAAQSDVQYLNDVINSNSFNVKAAYEVGGVRIQSFSDYVGRLVFDYVQMVGDLAAKKLPAHAYTKEFLFAQQFGMTGIKINMSLVPEVIEGGVAPGLDKDGNYAWKDGQSFGSTVYDNNGKRMTANEGFQLAIQIQNADGYSANCGTIAVGVSREHILKMLDDPDIRMIIPYHKSSLNHLVAAMNQIDRYTDYTLEQNTRVKNSKGEWTRLDASKDFNWNDTLQRVEREGKGAREAAEEYKRWCAENGYLPKFDEFAYHPNYYKLLEDFTAYDRDGMTPAPLGGVTMNFPGEDGAFGSMESLILSGLEEDAMLQAKQEAGVTEIVDEIEATLPVWEAQLAEQGEQFAIESGRQSLERTQMRDGLANPVGAGYNSPTETGRSGAIENGNETGVRGSYAEAESRGEVQAGVLDDVGRGVSHTTGSKDTRGPRAEWADLDSADRHRLTEATLAFLDKDLTEDGWEARALYPSDEDFVRDLYERAYLPDDGRGVVFEREAGWFTKNPTNLQRQMQAALSSSENSITDLPASEARAVEEDFDASMQGRESEDGAKFSRRVTDPETLAFLNDQLEKGEVVRTYKTFLELTDENGQTRLYPPMAAKQRADDGKLRMANAMAVGEWEESVGNPNSKGIISKQNSKGETRWYYRLVKDNGKTVDAAYDPYQHSSNVVLNDQFEEAYKRPNLVTYECVIPQSELTSGYRYSQTRDDGQIVEAALPVGEQPWKKGTVAGKLKNTDRVVYLSRWLMPMRRVGNSEVAQMYKDMFDKENSPVSVPFNVVPPDLLTELKKIGVPIDYEGSPMYKAAQERSAKKAVIPAKSAAEPKLSSRQKEDAGRGLTRQQSGMDIQEERPVKDVVSVGDDLVVEIDSKKSGLSSFPKGRWNAILQEQIRRELVGKTILTDDGDLISFTDRSAGEPTWGTASRKQFAAAKQTGDFSAINRKQLSLDHLASLVSTSKFARWSENDDPGNAFKRDGINHRDALIKIDGEYYDVDIATALNTDDSDPENYGDKFYDIKISEAPSTKIYGALPSRTSPYKIRFVENTSEKLSIAQKNRAVKNAGTKFVVEKPGGANPMAQAFANAGKIRTKSQPRYSVRNPEQDPGEQLRNDLLEQVRNGDADSIAEWVTNAFNKLEDQQENAKIRPPMIPSKGFVPKVSEQERAALDNTNERAAKKYGLMPKSEKPVDNTRLAKRNEQGGWLRRFLQNVATAKQTQTAQDYVKRFAFTDVHATYEVDSNERDLNKAKETIRDRGQDYAINKFVDDAAKALYPGQITETLALGQQLLIETSKEGNMAGFYDVLTSLALLSTQAGKSLQAFRMLKESGPIGELYYVKKAVDQLNDKHVKQLEAGKMSKITINEELSNAVLTAATEQDREEAMDALIKDIASQVPVTLAEKWNAWRYLAMLGNARTHIRNIIGNAVFVPLRFTKNLMAAAGEFVATKAGLMEEQDRTKALSVSRELRDFAKQDAQVMQRELQGSGKYNPARAILDARHILPGMLEKVSRGNGALLEFEDWLFLSPAYSNALAAALSHSGYSVEQLQTTVEGQKALNNARKIAIEEAQKATYRDFNAAASMLNRIKRMETGKASDKFIGLLLEGVLPFTKTPINILRRGVEYSPIGIMSSIFEAVHGVKNGNLDVAQFIDHLSAGLSGTAVAVLGYLLASLGFLRGKKDDKEEEFDKLQGYQDYSLQIGDVSATIDWAAPTALPLFTGAAVHQLMQGDSLEWSDAWDAMMMIAEPMMSLSMLDGLNSAISSASYADDSQKLATVASSAMTSYLGQAFPTLLGQLARSIDGTRRTTYVDKNSKVPSAIQRFVQSSVQSKTPVWESQKTPYIDAWGREDTAGSKLLGGLENFFSPSYINMVKTTDVDDELKKLYDATKEASVLPSLAAKYFSVGGERKDLTADEYVAYAKDVGSTKYTLLTQMLFDPRYMRLSDADKAKAVKKIYDYATAAGKYHIDKRYDLHGQGVWMEEAEAMRTDAQRFNRIWEYIEEYLSK